MQNFFVLQCEVSPTSPTSTRKSPEAGPNCHGQDTAEATLLGVPNFSPAEAVYFSSDEDDSEDSDENEIEEDSTNTPKSSQLPVAPPPKQRHLEVSVRAQHQLRFEKRKKDWSDALTAISKLLKSKKTVFEGGENGLQVYRARAIQSFLIMVIKNSRLTIEASERAAESHGFAVKWGGRSLRAWTRLWIKERCLPQSKKGCHGKVYSVLDDPVIRAELRTFVRSEKWSMNPSKLQEFSQGKLLPDAADKYLHHLVCEEMPRGLMKYMEVELFPRLQLKVKNGISISTARRWLRSEGFRYIGYRKGLYFDGHDCPDVLEYRNSVFLPHMAEYFHQMVRYIVGDVDKVVMPQNFVACPLVLVAQDEMTAQAHDTVSKSWVLGDQHKLQKKGVGCGLHQSDFICSTIGWLKDASQTLEYGKSYDGYWTGEMFVKQVCLVLINSNLELIISIS